MTTEVDWDAPLDADGDARAAALHRALQVEMPQLDALIEVLRGGVSCADWGFPQLADVHDPEQRALVSDQLLSAADGLQDALVDAGIAALGVDAETGPTGLPYSARDDSLSDMLRYQRLRRAVATFFDALGTALDCLAAVLIVVGRVPLSVQRADYTRLTALDPYNAHAKAFDEPVPQHQQELWVALLDKLRHAGDDGPDDWLLWSLEMRNALTHRGRVTNVYLPRRVSGRLTLPPTSLPQANYRYDLHLRHRPWLPSLEQILAAGYRDSWLDEPAGRTIRGLRNQLLGYCEQLAQWVRAEWTRQPPPSYVAPARRWVLPPPPSIAFQGVRPGGTTPIQGAIGGVNEEHLRLAERVRRLRAGLPDLDC